MVLDPASPLFLHPERFSACLVRRSPKDFHEGVGLADGPGYETEYLSEQRIVDACSQ
jgi:hypothetical protein